jgi:hypothetical protein
MPGHYMDHMIFNFLAHSSTVLTGIAASLCGFTNVIDSEIKAEKKAVFKLIFRITGLIMVICGSASIALLLLT